MPSGLSKEQQEEIATALLEAPEEIASKLAGAGDTHLHEHVRCVASDVIVRKLRKFGVQCDAEDAAATIYTAAVMDARKEYARECKRVDAIPAHEPTERESEDGSFGHADPRADWLTRQFESSHDIATLPPVLREAVETRFGDYDRCDSNREAAERLGISPTTLQDRLRRAAILIAGVDEWQRHDTGFILLPHCKARVEVEVELRAAA